MKFGFVYLIHNLLNDKVYIGKSLDTKRILQHFLTYDNLPLHKDIQQQGKKSFKADILYSYLGEEEMVKKMIKEAESRYIQQFSSTNPLKGYNISMGDGVIIKDNDIEEQRGKHIEGNNNPNYGNSLNKKGVIQYDIKGNRINSYDSISQAANQTGINISSIHSVCKGKRKTCGMIDAEGNNRRYIFKFA